MTANGLGETGKNVIANVAGLINVRGLSQRRLSAELRKAGCPVLPLGIARILKGERKVSTDELAALARVLEVTPAALMAPVTEVHGRARPAIGAVQDLADLIASGSCEVTRGRVDRALRRVQIEIEELLDEG
jgi:transcriptional regulator with XRE-family HTH domain